jgi:glucose/arabinose dehydrogenase
MDTHPELKSKVINPNVLVQPQMASLGMIFYPTSESTFPSQYNGFAAEHGSHGTVRIVEAMKLSGFL